MVPVCTLASRTFCIVRSLGARLAAGAVRSLGAQLAAGAVRSLRARLALSYGRLLLPGGVMISAGKLNHLEIDMPNKLMGC
ncbi:hypothetical protein chiPu_0002541 [Chiloscyllium punctatum]|uniref:Uncharacterized protein n=1 Tax=Chiloscyllium punctatum TaxID=137246 RepID=A0A401S162_CHIPU|nr:hypothetical protein [Chiloscyllium punctatum]